MSAKQTVAHKSAAEYAGFWLRAVAVVIDGILLQVAVSLVGFGVAAQPGMMGMSGGNGLVRLLLGLAYFVGMESSAYQATLGKLALGLKVTDTTGRRLTMAHALGRYVAKILSVITIGVGFLMAGWTERKQALHDIVAGTLVVRGR